MTSALSLRNAELIGTGLTAEVYAWEEDQVLKLFKLDHPGLTLLKTNREWIDREVLFSKIAHDHGLPVPRFWNLLEVDGRPGIILDRIDGPSATMSKEKDLPRISKWGKMLAELMASVHSVDLSDVDTGLPGFAAPEELFASLIEHVDFWTVDQRNRIREHADSLPDGNYLCHGDFHMSNIIMAVGGPVIIDWSTGHRGNRWGDVANTSAHILMNPYTSSDPMWLRTLHRIVMGRINHVFLRTYTGLCPDADDQLSKWLVYAYAAKLGLMSLIPETGTPEDQTPLLSFLENSSYLPEH
jgi:tRNA A-37 threonylcarbamoyl transferase component Bud32